MNTRNHLTRIGLAGVVVLLSAAQEMTAQDPLDSWARRYVPGLTTHLNAVAFGNGVFVAVGENSTVATSTDGANWTVGTPGSYGNFLGIRFLNDQFIALGSSDKILFSTDGASWTAQTLPGLAAWDVAYGNGVYVVAGSATYVSSNGVNWATTEPKATETAPGVNRVVTIPLDAVSYGGGRFVGLPAFLNPLLQTPRHGVSSTNGVDWSEGGDAAPTSLNVGAGGHLVLGNGLFLGACNGYGEASASSDGSSWCCLNHVISPFAFRTAVAFGQGHFVRVRPGQSPELPTIYSSTNGTSWVSRFSIPGFVLPGDPLAAYYQSMKGQARGAVFGNGTFVLVGEAGYIVQSGNLGGSPIILTQPQDRGAVVGNPASFSVLASGSLPLAFQWFHNGTLLANATNSSYAIAQVQAPDTGGYQVVITNSFGSVTSRVAQLSVSFLNIKTYAGIEILGVPGRTYRIEATPTTGPLDWQPLTNLVLPTSPYIWIDYESPTAGQRLYRAAELP